MIIKVGNEFLDFDDFVDVEKNIKLFEDMDEINGDFAYAFSVPLTSKNIKALGFPLPDVNPKRIYTELSSEILGDDGNTLYRGNIVVERIIGRNIECSFYSGNHNWFALLEGELQGDYLDDYDDALTNGGIQSSWTNTDGIVYPLMDAGLLVHRKVPFLKPEDFVGCIFAKTVFRLLFNPLGIKLKGELFQDPIFNALLVCANKNNERFINEYSAYAASTFTQSTNPPTTTSISVEFDDMTNYPYFSSGAMYVDNGRTEYEAFYKSLVRVEITLKIQEPGDFQWFNLFKEPSGGSIHIFRSNEGTTGSISGSVDVVLEAGERIYVRTGLFINDVYPGSTFKVTPLYIWATPGRSLVPAWTKREFVNEILKPFNTIISYDPNLKELTIDLFQKVKYKQTEDISEFITDMQFDYTELGQAFAKINFFKYQESEDSEFMGYNATEFIKYGSGSIALENFNLQDTVDLVESSFAAPVTYVHKAFDCSLERVDLIEEDISGVINFTSVIISISSGLTRFIIPPNSEIEEQERFIVGDLVRISESQGVDLLGDWEVYAVGDGYVEFFQLPWDSGTPITTSGKLERIRPAYSSNDNAYIFIHAGLLTVPQISEAEQFYLDQEPLTQIGFSFFNLLSNNTQVNDIFNQSLKFGPSDNPLDYQTDMITNYWQNSRLVMSDPVKAIATANLSKKFFLTFDFLRPVIVKYNMSTSLWFISRISGYKGSEYDCEVELIKLS